MKIIIASALLIALSVLTFGQTIQPASAAMVGAAATNPVYSFNFGSSLDPWKPVAFAEPITADTLKLKSETAGSDGVENNYAALTSSTKGVVGMTANFTNTGNTVRVKFQAKSIKDCGDCVPVVSIANSNIASAVPQFTQVGGPLAKSWGTYSYETAIKGDVVIIVGFLNAKGQFARAAIDNIDVSTFVR